MTCLFHKTHTHTHTHTHTLLWALLFTCLQMLSFPSPVIASLVWWFKSDWALCSKEQFLDDEPATCHCLFSWWQDFTVDLMKDINSAFEHVVNRVMEPLGNFSSHIASQYQNAATGVCFSTCLPVCLPVQSLSVHLCLWPALLSLCQTLTPSLPWCRFKMTNESAKSKTLRPFCLLFHTGMWKDFHQNA